MNPLAIALVICSTFMHAGWNVFVRHQRSEEAWFRKMLLFVVVVGLVPMAISEGLTHSLPAKAWICAAVSGVFAGVYFLSLARAYGAADFTVVYPVARALPVVILGLADFLRGRAPTGLGWIGIVLVVGGCLLSPLHSFGDLRVKHYFNRSTVWIMLTAVGTVGYSLSDKFASEIVVRGAATAARYGYLFFAFGCMTYLGLSRVFSSTATNKRFPRWSVAVIAVLNFGSYWLVLWAYQLSERASYVVAFRQFSIVLGVVLAFAILKEKGLKVRLLAVFVITAGLILVGLSRNG